MNLTRANVEGNGFDKDLDVVYDAAKRTGEEDRALEENEEDRALNDSEEEEDDDDEDGGDRA